MDNNQRVQNDARKVYENHSILKEDIMSKRARNIVVIAVVVVVALVVVAMLGGPNIFAAASTVGATIGSTIGSALGSVTGSATGSSIP